MHKVPTAVANSRGVMSSSPGRGVWKPGIFVRSGFASRRRVKVECILSWLSECCVVHGDAPSADHLHVRAATNRASAHRTALCADLNAGNGTEWRPMADI
jgi:hypothetical protein